MLQYHIFEIQRRPDGVNNVVAPVSRNSLATGLAFFYERCAVAAATTLYVSVTLAIMDSDGNLVKPIEKIPTAYVAEE